MSPLISKRFFDVPKNSGTNAVGTSYARESDAGRGNANGHNPDFLCEYLFVHRLKCLR